MRRFILLFHLLLFVQGLTKENFLKKVRATLLNNVWFRSQGSIIARFKESDELIGPKSIHTASILNANNLDFQIILDNYQEVQVQFTSKKQVREEKIVKDYIYYDSIYEKLSIRPYDLSMSFLYWDLIYEFERESLGILRIKCRVLFLANPKKADEFVKIWISESYLAPIKIQWIKGTINDDPYQELEIKKVQQDKNLYFPKEIFIENKEAKIKISYDEIVSGIEAENKFSVFFYLN